ncbi:MAG: prepilin-type N-terminal cleavage/methylation domain-containing protein [Fretibacterium sp.]|nr:prepilin-type N-terminal cleavage/methylation domain-containing protein [Fretibacterium sp.]
MKMRKGFTLVELLIVIVIIGILAAAMLLSTGSATASAQAATIISDMRSLKSACLLLYADSMDDANLVSTIATDKIKVLHKYIDNPDKFKTDGDPAGLEVGVDGKWWISYKSPVDAQVQEKLEAKAGSTGLYGTATVGGAAYKKGDAKLYMVAR